MPALLRDLAAASRSWRRRPAFAAAVVSTLALAIGANTAIFSMIRGVLLRPLPFAHADRLVAIQMREAGADRQPFSIPDFLDLRAGARGLDAIVGWCSAGANLTGVEEPVALRAQWTTPGFFDLLGVHPALGRTPSPEEERAGGGRVVLLGDEIFRSRFGGDRAILGRTLLVNGEPSTVIGVLPPDFVFLAGGVDLAAPLILESDRRRDSRGAAFLRLIGRRRPGIGPAAVAADLDRIVARLRTEYPDTNASKQAVRVVPLAEVVVESSRGTLLVLQGAVAFVLLIACTNLANLLLARIAARRSELALRSALGAERGDLLRQVLAESSALALAGGALGVLLALAGIRGLLSLKPAFIPRAADIGVDVPVLLFNVALSLATGLALGIFPALQGTRQMGERIRGAARGHTEGRGGGRTRAFLVTAEVGLSLVLLFGAGLLIRTLHRLRDTDPGFRADHLLAAQLSLPKRYATPEALDRYAGHVTARLAALPGVSAVGAASLNPLTAWRASVSFVVEGRPDASRKDAPSASYRAVSPGYFRTLGVPIIAGRDVEPRDRVDTVPVALISQTLAKQHFRNRSPLGERLSIDDREPWRSIEIVGVVGDVKHTGLDAGGTADVYVPYPQTPANVSGYLANIFCVAIRTAVPPGQLADPVRRGIQALDRDVAVAAIRPMEEAFGDSLAERRFRTTLIEIFGATALILALAGIYSVTAFAVAERTREIGVRMSLGSGRGRILGLVVGQALVPVAGGLAFGTAAALALGRLVSGMLFGVQAHDPVTLAAVILLVGIAACLASGLPAFRATRIDPVRALRGD